MTELSIPLQAYTQSQATNNVQIDFLKEVQSQKQKLHLTVEPQLY